MRVRNIKPHNTLRCKTTGKASISLSPQKCGMDSLDQILAEAEAETLVVEEPIKVDKENYKQEEFKHKSPASM